jgi:TRAP-type C4-dicarboxylate transport system substrate-binding protein
VKQSLRKEDKIMRTARLGFILSMIALSCFLFACAETAPTVKPTESGKKTTIRIGSPFKTGHILVDAGEKFKELVEKGSGGRIAVEMQI